MREGQMIIGMVILIITFTFILNYILRGVIFI
jgi:preprotein translocase subunit SecE